MIERGTVPDSPAHPSTWLEHRVTFGELAEGIGALASHTHSALADLSSPLPYRYVRVAGSRREAVRTLSLVVVVRGRMDIVVDGEPQLVGPAQYAVLGARMSCRGHVDAQSREPLLALVLRIDPSVIRRLTTEMGTARVSEPAPDRPCGGAAPASGQVDPELLDVLIRFVRCTRTAAERHTLLPIYLVELLFLLLQRGQRQRFTELASRQAAENRVACVVGFIHDNLDAPITVGDLARQAHLSVSAFTTSFRAATGFAPYEYVKQSRLDRGRELLSEGRYDVASVARRVGYTSSSHFISQFRARYGTTPKAFSTRHRRDVLPDVTPQR